MYNVVQVTKSGLSREEFMSSTGEAIIQDALTDSRVGVLAVGKTGMANLGASLVPVGDAMGRVDDQCRYGVTVDDLVQESFEIAFGLQGSPMFGFEQFFLG